MTRKEFIKVAAELRSIYPAAQLMQTPAALMAWYEALKDYSAGTVARVTIFWTHRKKAAPTLAEFRALVEAACKDKPIELEKIQDQRRRQRRQREADELTEYAKELGARAKEAFLRE